MFKNFFRKETSHADKRASKALADAEKYITSSNQFLNNRQGPEFVMGIREAFEPLSARMTRKTGQTLGYGDVIHQFALSSRNDPDKTAELLLSFADAAGGAKGAGIRFVLAQIIIDYAGIGAYGSDGLLDTVSQSLNLSQSANEILSLAGRWSQQ
ncbi:MAG: hypothetical protein IT535_04625 [Bauldia sp.]|nr:hypothetical protein [Bauldia sp.]